ncbi:hypothetical protein ACWEN3_13865 [Streptomyces sp. NPDC004561]
MNQFVKRISRAAAAAAFVGGAVLGAGGPASAATPGAEQHISSPAVLVAVGEGRRVVPGSNGGQVLNGDHNAFDGNHGWRDDNDVWGSWYWNRHDDDHGGHYRWDGHHLYRWHQGHWVIVVQVRGHADLWILDQLSLIRG